MRINLDFIRQTHLGTRTAAAVCLLAMVEVAVSMGIGRFAFTPLLPLMIRDDLLDLNAGAWLASSNYFGYVLGALTVSWVRVKPQILLRGSLAAIVAVTTAMGGSDSLDMAVWLVLRFAAGVFSAWAFVLTSAWALDRLASAQRPDLAGVIYGGTGLGIATVGLYCVVAAGPGVSTQWLWLGLGALAAVAIAPSLLLSRGPRVSSTGAVREVGASAGPDSSTAGLVVCYGVMGLGYILPATFLPTLARSLVDEPRIFGLAWPLFGLASLVSTIVAARVLKRMNRLRVWAVTHLIMALGVLMPSIWLTPTSIAITALFVGGTFMVTTTVALQEVRSRAQDRATAVLGYMTAAFAIGQLTGPLVPSALVILAVTQVDGINHAFQLAAAALALSAAYLSYRACR